MSGNTRKLTRARFIPLYAALALVAAFFLTSVAIGTEGNPRFRNALKVAELPVAALGPQEQLSASNAIGDSADRYGIEVASYRDARIAAETTLGPLLVVPGSTGVCLVLQGRSACGDPGAPEQPVLALFVSTPEGMIGGGIVAADVRTVELSQGAAQRVIETPAGHFALSPADGFIPRAFIEVVAR